MQRISSSPGPTSSSIVQAVAAEMDRDPSELRPLQEVVDTDAVNALFSGPDDAGLSMSLTYEGCRLTVDRGGVAAIRRIE